MYKQIIIVRKDLEMTPGKMSAQVSHASMAFLTAMLQQRVEKINATKFAAYYREWDSTKDYEYEYLDDDLNRYAKEARENGERSFYAYPEQAYGNHKKWIRCEDSYVYRLTVDIQKGLQEEWINGIFTKCVLQAKNRNQLLKAVRIADELGMEEGKDYFLIKDCCLTELEPEEVDDKGIGRTLTCIGFRPMDSDIINEIGKKFQLYR